VPRYQLHHEDDWTEAEGIFTHRMMQRCLLAAVRTQEDTTTSHLFAYTSAGASLSAPDWMAMCCASLLLGQHACTNKATKQYPAQLVSTAIALCDVNDVEDA